MSSEVKEVTKQTISYALDLVDPAVKGKWPGTAADQAALQRAKWDVRGSIKGSRM